MKETFDQFKRKVRNRQFAIDNSWRSDERQESVPSVGGWYDPAEMPWDALNQNLQEADGAKYFNGYLPIESHRRVLGGAIVFVKRAMRKLLKLFWGWYIFPQYQRMSFFNGKVVNALHLERDMLCQLVQQNQQLAQRIEQLQKTVEGLPQQDSTVAIQDLQATVAGMTQEMQANHAAAQQMQTDMAALARENEELRAKMAKMENLPTDDDEFYHAFEETFRGSQDLIRARLQVYVPIVRERIPDWSTAVFVDVGSGRGEWLDILKDNGATNYVGIDLNARQNKLCKEKGHKVLQMDCLEYLGSLPDGSVDMVSGFQVIEHFAMSDLMALLRESYRVLKKGGIILFETQNPRNLIVGADTFYMDPSHKRPLEPEMVSFFAKWCGFGSVQYIQLNPDQRLEQMQFTDQTTMPENSQLYQKLNDIVHLLYGPQDYTLLGTKE